MTRLKTAMLRELVAPSKLEDVLESLHQSGAIESYYIDKDDVELEISTYAEISLLMQEESRVRENPRPYVKNRLTKQKK